MKFSWNSLKISIAGAKLSHLVQKDKIWDHGSMTEQVKSVFYVIEKAKNKKDAEPIKKYVTAKGFEQLDQLIKRIGSKPLLKNAVLTEVSILEVTVATNKNPDRFIALIKGKRQLHQNENAQMQITSNKNFGIENFTEQWLFTREGEWWLLDGIKSMHSFRP